jgi:hypothetical protein
VGQRARVEPFLYLAEVVECEQIEKRTIGLTNRDCRSHAHGCKVRQHPVDARKEGGLGDVLGMRRHRGGARDGQRDCKGSQVEQ